MGDKHKDGFRLGINVEVLGYAHALDSRMTAKGNAMVTLTVKIPVKGKMPIFVQCSSVKDAVCTELNAVPARALVRIAGNLSINEYVAKDGTKKTGVTVWADEVIIEEIYAPSDRRSDEVDVSDLPF